MWEANIYFRDSVEEIMDTLRIFTMGIKQLNVPSFRKCGFIFWHVGGKFQNKVEKTKLFL